MAIIETCLGIMRSAWGAVQSQATPSPISAGALGLLTVSLAWAAVRTLALWGRGWRLVQRFRPYRWGDHAKVDRALARTPALCGASIRLGESPAPRAFTAGLLRPVICLTRGLVDCLSERELQTVLLHERAHQIRRDPVRLALIDFLVRTLWFLPAARPLGSFLADRIEQAADDRVASTGGDPLELASALVKVAKEQLLWHKGLGMAYLGSLSVEERVRRLLDPSSISGTRLDKRSVVASGLMAVMMVVALVSPLRVSAISSGIAADPSMMTGHMVCQIRP